jgi:putative holliday junction resolvase
MTTPGRVLAIDNGTKRVGLALSDELRITGQPYRTLEPKNQDDLLGQLKDIIASENISEIIIGLPRRLDGSTGDMGKKAKELATKIRESFPVKVKLWDERFSTHAAERMLLEGDVRRKKRRQVIDKTAAAWILQGYLDSLG